MFSLSREAASLLLIAYLLGLVMLMTAGIYDGPLAEPALLLALGCLALLVVQFGHLLSRKAFDWPSPNRRWLVLLPMALAVFSIATWADQRLLTDSDRPPRVIRAIQLLDLVLLGSYVPSLWSTKPESPRWKTSRFTLFAVLLVVGGASVMRLSPTPHIDVWAVHDEGAKALLGGHNPYVDVQVHGTAGNVYLIAFPYPPTPCYLNAIAYALGKDVRWGMLTALLVTGVSMRLLARKSASPRSTIDSSGLVEDAPALLLWLTPKTFFFLEQSWNDVYPLTFLALATATHAYGKRHTAAAFLGLALSAKQTMILLVPLVLLLGLSVGQWVTCLGVAAATLLPFVIADFDAMKLSIFDRFLTYAPRTDGLSGLIFLEKHFGIAPRSAPGFLLTASTLLLAVWRAPRTRYAFALATALAIFLFFFFNIWMFINNYYFVAGLALLAAATSMGGEPQGSTGVRPAPP